MKSVSSPKFSLYCLSKTFFLLPLSCASTFMLKISGTVLKTLFCCAFELTPMYFHQDIRMAFPFPSIHSLNFPVTGILKKKKQNKKT